VCLKFLQTDPQHLEKCLDIDRLSEIRTVALGITSARSEWTLVALDGVVNNHVSLELVFAFEGMVADVTLERFLSAVNYHVHAQILICLEALCAHRAHVVSCGTTPPSAPQWDTQVYTVFHKKYHPFLSVIITTYDDQFTQNFLPVLTQEILIQNISTKCDCWLNILC